MADSSERSQQDEDGPEASSSSSRRESKSRSSRSSRHHHHRSSGGSSSGHRRKSSSLPSPKNSSKEKLRLAPAVAASPGAENVSGSAPSSARKSSKLRQADAVATSNISSGSDQRSEKKALRQADGVASSETRSSKTEKKKQESRSLTSPGGRRNDKRKSSKFSRDRRTGADASGEIQGPPLALQEASSRETAPVTLEATAAPNIEDQLEAARQQGREEGRVERRSEQRDEEEQQRQQEDNKPVVIAASLEQTENKSSREYKYLLVALVIAAIAGGITAWQLLSSNQTSAGFGSPSPTAEDCKAVSEGMKVEGQDELTSRTIDVALNLAMASNKFNLEVLKQELEAELQQVALPLLVGCSNEGSVSIENNVFLIENAVIVPVSISNSTGCSSNADETACASFDFQLQLFLGDGTELDQPILDLVTGLFQDEGLLELLNLASPVTEVNVNKVVPNIPSFVPSSSPSTMGGISGTPFDDLMIPNDDIPTVERCEAIGNGTLVIEQEDLVVLTYEALLDVTLSFQPQLSLVSIDLQTKLQAVI
ncbi:MAG: hypothetical protein SGBAC_013323, partial [Bacillariaceae sp.]